MTPRLIIFDLDGTLVDSAPDLALAIDAMLNELQLPVAGQARVRDWVGNGATNLVERALAAAGAPPAMVTVALASFLEHYYRLCTQTTALYPGVETTLKQLAQRHIKMAVVTNKPRRFVSPILQHLQIASYFEQVLGGDDLPQKKPDPAPLRWCMQQLDAAPADTLMVGDSCNDIEAARRAGIGVVAVDYGYNHGRPITGEGADKVISHFDQLLDLVE